MARRTVPRRRAKRYGWIPDLPDLRDYLYLAPSPAVAPLPPKVDLRTFCPPVYEQGELGSCTANAIGGAIEFDQMKQALPDVFVPSRLFIYYNERVIQGTVDADPGPMTTDVLNGASCNGAP